MSSGTGSSRGDDRRIFTGSGRDSGRAWSCHQRSPASGSRSSNTSSSGQKLGARSGARSLEPTIRLPDYGARVPAPEPNIGGHGPQVAAELLPGADVGSRDCRTAPRSGTQIEPQRESDRAGSLKLNWIDDRRDGSGVAAGGGHLSRDAGLFSLPLRTEGSAAWPRENCSTKAASGWVP